MAPFFLPATEAVFGREGKPCSHWEYYCNEEQYEKFNDPFLISSDNEEERKNACIVEIRGKSGLQTIFPGSTHESGEPIAWHKKGEPSKVERKQLRRAVALLASAVLFCKFWRSGIRQDLTLALSGAMLRNGLGIKETENLIRAICSATGDTETAERIKAVKATDDKLKAGSNVYGFPKLAELTDKKLVETVCKWLDIQRYHETEQVAETQAADFTSEPKPLDATLKPVEKIDDDFLPTVLVNWLRPASKVIGCPFDFLVLSAVVIVGSLIGSRLRVKPFRNSDWFVVSNLYGGLVGLPSTKKTPALDEARKPILELQSSARKDYAKAKDDYEISAKFYEKESAGLLKKTATLADYKNELTKLNKPQQPILRRYEVNDITAPRLAQIINENKNGVLQSRDELMGLLKSLEADYNSNARPFLLELWKGALSYALDRQDGREIQIESGTLSIIGGIQPSKLQRYISEAYSTDESDGFPQRFLFAYPDTSRSGNKPSGSDYQNARKGFAEANEIIKKIAQADFKGKVIGSNGDQFHIVKFSAEAQTIIDQWKDEIDAEAESLQLEDEAFSSFLYKLPKNCFAIALIFHCLETISDFSDEISVETTLRAINYTQVLISHARRVFALGENQIFALAQTALGKIKKGELANGFTVREMSRKQWSGLRSKETVQDVLSLLVEYGYLKEYRPEGDGRPTVRYSIHPSLVKEVKND
jgi:hypothetical protein